MLEKFEGAMLGLAVGDALGTTIEFTEPNSFEPMKDIVGGGPFDLEAGQWTDDTSMALCLAESLVVCEKFDAKDQMERYLRWYKEGYWSCKDECFDIGNTTLSALLKFESSGNCYAGSESSSFFKDGLVFNVDLSSGNGSIMRLVPVVLFYYGDPDYAIGQSAESSRTTHGSEDCIHACRLMAGIIYGALEGRSKEEILSEGFTPAKETWEDAPLSQNIREISLGSYKRKEPPEIRGTGWVVQSLEAALWAFHSSTSFEEGALKAVNLGEDADTTGAVYGQIAGAYYGIEGIPTKWREIIYKKDEIVSLARNLFEINNKKK